MTSIMEARSVAIPGRLAPVTLRVEQPSLVAVIGPNGGGKTSLLRAVGRVEEAEGWTLVDGQSIDQAAPARRMRLIGYLPASREVAWPIRVRDIVELGMPATGESRVDQLLSTLDLSSLAGRPIDRLSTGERARVLLARAMAARPRLLLLDEPLSNLDPYWALQTLELLRDTVRQEGSVILVALHDLTQLEAFDRALLVDRGRIVADSEPSRVLESQAFSSAFRVELAAGRWRISETVRLGEDPRSSQ